MIEMMTKFSYRSSNKFLNVILPNALLLYRIPIYLQTYSWPAQCCIFYNVWVSILVICHFRGNSGKLSLKESDYTSHAIAFAVENLQRFFCKIIFHTFSVITNSQMINRFVSLSNCEFQLSHFMKIFCMDDSPSLIHRLCKFTKCYLVLNFRFKNFYRFIQQCFHSINSSSVTAAFTLDQKQSPGFSWGLLTSYYM